MADKTNKMLVALADRLEAELAEARAQIAAKDAALQQIIDNPYNRDQGIRVRQIARAARAKPDTQQPQKDLAQVMLTENTRLVAEKEAFKAQIAAKDAQIERLYAAISWIERPFIDDETPLKELHQRIDLCVKDSKRAALKPDAQEIE